MSVNIKPIRRELLILLILLVPVIYLFLEWNHLPEQIPIHWNLKGEVDNYGAKYSLALLNLGIYVLLLLLPKIDPRKKNYKLFSSSYYIIRLAVTFFLSTLYLLTLLKANGQEIDLVKSVAILILLLLTVLGNYMGTLKQNWFVGIRLPWTLESDTVWRKTHQMAGKLWFWLGLAALIVALFLPANASIILLTVVALILVIVPSVYSYVLFKKEKNQD